MQGVCRSVYRVHFWRCFKWNNCLPVTNNTFFLPVSSAVFLTFSRWFAHTDPASLVHSPFHCLPRSLLHRPVRKSVRSASYLSSAHTSCDTNTDTLNTFRHEMINTYGVSLPVTFTLEHHVRPVLFYATNVTLLEHFKDLTTFSQCVQAWSGFNTLHACTMHSYHTSRT